MTDQLCRAMGLPVGDEDLRQCVWEVVLSAYYEMWREALLGLGAGDFRGLQRAEAGKAGQMG